MVKILNESDIMLTRGDTAAIQLTITDEQGEEYQIKEGDSVYLTIKDTYMTEGYLVRKVLEDGFFTFRSEDTINMNFGSYDYDIRLINSSITVTVLTGTFIVGGGTNE